MVRAGESIFEQLQSQSSLEDGIIGITDFFQQERDENNKLLFLLNLEEERIAPKIEKFGENSLGLFLAALLSILKTQICESATEDYGQSKSGPTKSLFSLKKTPNKSTTPSTPQESTNSKQNGLIVVNVDSSLSYPSPFGLLSSPPFISQFFIIFTNILIEIDILRRHFDELCGLLFEFLNILLSLIDNNGTLATMKSTIYLNSLKYETERTQNKWNPTKIVQFLNTSPAHPNNTFLKETAAECLHEFELFYPNIMLEQLNNIIFLNLKNEQSHAFQSMSQLAATTLHNWVKTDYYFNVNASDSANAKLMDGDQAFFFKNNSSTNLNNPINPAKNNELLPHISNSLTNPKTNEATFKNIIERASECIQFLLEGGKSLTVWGKFELIEKLIKIQEIIGHAQQQTKIFHDSAPFRQALSPIPNFFFPLFAFGYNTLLFNESLRILEKFDYFFEDGDYPIAFEHFFIGCNDLTLSNGNRVLQSNWLADFSGTHFQFLEKKNQHQKSKLLQNLIPNAFDNVNIIKYKLSFVCSLYHLKNNNYEQMSKTENEKTNNDQKQPQIDLISVMNILNDCKYSASFQQRGTMKRNYRLETIFHFLFSFFNKIASRKSSLDDTQQEIETIVNYSCDFFNDVIQFLNNSQHKTFKGKGDSTAITTALNTQTGSIGNADPKMPPTLLNRLNNKRNDAEDFPPEYSFFRDMEEAKPMDRTQHPVDSGIFAEICLNQQEQQKTREDFKELVLKSESSNKKQYITFLSSLINFFEKFHDFPATQRMFLSRLSEKLTGIGIKTFNFPKNFGLFQYFLLHEFVDPKPILSNLKLFVQNNSVLWIGDWRLGNNILNTVCLSMITYSVANQMKSDIFTSCSDILLTLTSGYNNMDIRDRAFFYHQLLTHLSDEKLLFILLDSFGDAGDLLRSHFYDTNKLASVITSPSNEKKQKKNGSNYMEYFHKFIVEKSIFQREEKVPKIISKPFLKIKRIQVLEKNYNPIEVGESGTVEQINSTISEKTKKLIVNKYFGTIEKNTPNEVNSISILFKIMFNELNEESENSNYLFGVTFDFKEAQPTHFKKLKNVHFPFIHFKSHFSELENKQLPDDYVFKLNFFPQQPLPATFDVQSTFSSNTGLLCKSILAPIHIYFEDFLKQIQVPAELSNDFSNLLQWKLSAIQQHQSLMLSVTDRIVFFSTLNVLYEQIWNSNNPSLHQSKKLFSFSKAQFELSNLYNKKLKFFLIFEQGNEKRFMVRLLPKFHILLRFFVENDKTSLEMKTDYWPSFSFVDSFLSNEE